MNRPGFAKFFLDSASEERQHSLKLIEYLLMRGELTTHTEFDKIIDSPVSHTVVSLPSCNLPIKTWSRYNFDYLAFCLSVIQLWPNLLTDCDNWTYNRTICVIYIIRIKANNSCIYYIIFINLTSIFFCVNVISLLYFLKFLLPTVFMKPKHYIFNIHHS